jgi:predicted MFS family arabinose efflux permease
MERRLTSGLRHAGFRRLWAGQVVSAVGDQVFPVAAAVAALDAGEGAGGVGVVLGARFLAVAVVALAGGVLADRYRRTLVMIAADAWRAVAVGALFLMTVGGGDVSVPVLAVLVLVVGMGEAVFQPAQTALVAGVVPPEDLPSANALNSLGRRVATVVGPALGGVLVTVAGPGPAFGVNALSFLVSILTLLGVREPALPSRQGGAGPLRESLEGVRVLWSMRWAGAVVLALAVLLPVVVAPVYVLLPVVSREVYGIDALFSATLSAEAVGAVAGAVLSARWRPARAGTVAMIGVATMAVLPIALVVAAPFAVVLLAGVVMGIALEPFQVWWMTAIQTQVPREALARVSAVYLTASLALMPAGMAVAGLAAQAFGANAVLVVAAVVAIAVPLLTLQVRGVAAFGAAGIGAET